MDMHTGTSFWAWKVNHRTDTYTERTLKNIGYYQEVNAEVNDKR